MTDDLPLHRAWCGNEYDQAGTDAKVLPGVSNGCEPGCQCHACPTVCDCPCHLQPVEGSDL